MFLTPLSQYTPGLHSYTQNLNTICLTLSVAYGSDYILITRIESCKQLTTLY